VKRSLLLPLPGVHFTTICSLLLQLTEVVLSCLHMPCPSTHTIIVQKIHSSFVVHLQNHFTCKSIDSSKLFAYIISWARLLQELNLLQSLKAPQISALSPHKNVLVPRTLFLVTGSFAKSESAWPMITSLNSGLLFHFELGYRAMTLSGVETQ